MDSNTIVLVVIAALVAVPLVVSLVTHGGAKAISGTVDGARSRRAVGQRSFLSSWGADALAGPLEQRCSNEAGRTRSEAFRRTPNLSFTTSAQPPNDRS